MFGFILGILVIIAGIISAVASARKVTKTPTDRWGNITGDPVTTRPYKKFTLPIVAIALVLSVVFVFLGCIVSVPTGHTGILTTFGKVEDNTLEAGFNFKAPWQNVVNMDNRVQKANTMLSCFSADIQEVDVSYTVNYQIDKLNAQEIYKTIGKSYYDTVIVPNIAEAVKVATAKYTAEELVSSRADLATAIEALLTESLAKYNIQVVSAAIEDMDFTDAFTNAVEAKQVAAQNKLQAEIEQEKMTMEAEAAAQRAVIEANAAADTAKIKAQSDYEVKKIEADALAYAGEKEAEKNRAIAESITDTLIDYYYIEQWSGELPDSYVGSDNVSTIVGVK